MFEKLKKFYDELYQKNPSVFGVSSLAFLKSTLNAIPTNSSWALDIGAGEGRTSQLLAEHGFNVDAVDLSENAFSTLEKTGKITTHIISISDFKIMHEYELVYMALVAHHLPNEVFYSVLKNLQEHTPKGGVHIFRIFTINSDFYRESKNIDRFYDDGQNLNNLYSSWKIVSDTTKASKAAAQNSMNEVREVVFQKE